MIELKTQLTNHTNIIEDAYYNYDGSCYDSHVQYSSYNKHIFIL